MPCHLPVCSHTSAKLPESSVRLSLAPYSVVATHAALLVPLLINYLHSAQDLGSENVDLVRKSPIYVYLPTRRSRHLVPFCHHSVGQFLAHGSPYSVMHG